MANLNGASPIDSGGMHVRRGTALKGRASRRRVPVATAEPASELVPSAGLLLPGAAGGGPSFKLKFNADSDF
jgi:hypothetical protein